MKSYRFLEEVLFTVWSQGTKSSQKYKVSLSSFLNLVGILSGVINKAPYKKQLLLLSVK